MSPRTLIAAVATGLVAVTSGVSGSAGAATTPTAAVPYDVNGDGHRDMLVSAPGDQHDTGLIHVGLGSANGTVVGRSLYRRSAVLVSADFNGDGSADVASSDLGGREVDVDYGDRRHPGATIHQRLTAARQHSQAGAAGPVTDDGGFGYGWSLTAGDFNDDGYADLAIGHPYADVPPSDLVPGGVSTGAAGVVLVRYGSADGLDDSQQLAPGHYEEWNDRSANVDGGVANGDHFGYAVTSGDLNGDGIDDLVVGIPGKAAGDVTAAGAVTEIFGTASGLSADGNTTFSLSTPGIKGEPVQQKDCDEDDGCDLEGENFGAALAAGDIDGDGFADVAVGTPDKVVVPGAHDADGNPGHDGSLSVLFGAPTGLTARNQYVTYNTPGVPGTVAATGAGYARFANELVMGDFNADGRADVAAAAGDHVLVFRGGTSRLRTHHVHRLSGAPLSHGDTVVTGIGMSMLAIDIDGDGADDLLAGAPGATVAGGNGAGAVAWFTGGAGGLAQKRARLLTERRPFGGSNSDDDQFGYVGAQNVFITGD